VNAQKKSNLIELAALFAKLGFIGFGGPAAHIAMLEDEVVTRRGWMDSQEFLDIVGATNIVPGPNSTEVALHIGYIRGGFPGLFVAGLCFIGPAVLTTTLVAWVYVNWGKVSWIEPMFIGIKPAIIAVILGALYKLGRKAVKSWRLALLAIPSMVAVLMGVSEALTIVVGGLLGMVILRLIEKAREDGGTAALAAAGATVPLWKLGLFFAKVGAVLYGSGYVLVAFLESEVVHENKWITYEQLLDALAMGQFTPGPVLSTAAFIGYLTNGWIGAIVASLAIFLPSFVFVVLLRHVLHKLRKNPWTAAFLDAVNVSAVALMGIVVVELGIATLTDWRSWLIAGVSGVVVLRFKPNAAWIVAGGAAAGWFLHQF
jgi:chromate transporter